MKKLMENWRSYEKEVLSELEDPYAHMEQPPSPITGEPMVYGAGSEQAFDVFLKTIDVADAAYWKYAMEPYADEVYAVDAASKALYDLLGIPEAHASTLLRYGIPDSEWLLNRTEEQLAEIGMTKDEAKQLAYFEWTDVVWDPHDPIDAGEVALAATGAGLAAGGIIWALNRVRHLARLPGFISDAARTRRLFKAMPALSEMNKYDKIYDAAGNLTDSTRKFGVPRTGVTFGQSADGTRSVITHIGEVRIKGLDKSIKPIDGGKLRSRPAPVGPEETQVSIPFMPQRFTEFDADGNPIGKYLYFDKTDFNQMVDELPELRDLANLSNPSVIERAGGAAANFLGDFDAMTIPKAAASGAKNLATVPLRHPKTTAAIVAGGTAGGLLGLDTEGKSQAEIDAALRQLQPIDDETPQEILNLIDVGSSGVEHGTGVDYWEDKPPGRRSVRYQESIERRKEIIREEIIKYFSNRR